MSIYDILVQRNKIKEERFIREPMRVKQKVQGWMWEAEYEVITKDDKTFVFYMWNHFYEDNGSIEWVPTIEDVRKYMYCQFVPCGKKQVECCWYTILINGVYYVSKRGFFGYENQNYKEEAIKQIKNGEWETNPDIEILL